MTKQAAVELKLGCRLISLVASNNRASCGLLICTVLEDVAADCMDVPVASTQDDTSQDTAKELTQKVIKSSRKGETNKEVRDMVLGDVWARGARIGRARSSWRSLHQVRTIQLR